jgi:gas vesicle protein
MNKDRICGFLIGLGAGGALAMLFAPSSGRKTRTQIAQAAAEGVAQVKGYGGAVRDSTRDLVERGKEAFSRQKDEVTQAAAAAS